MKVRFGPDVGLHGVVVYLLCEVKRSLGELLISSFTYGK